MLKKFVARSGGCEYQLPATVDHFLQYQTFIQELDFLATVRRALEGADDDPIGVLQHGYGR